MKRNKLIKFIEYKSRISIKHKKFAKCCDFFLRVIFNMDFPCTVRVGEGLVLPHLGVGVVIHPRTTIGSNCKIYHNVTIGCRNNEGPPQISNNVLIGAGACILGNVKIGDNVAIGANSVVLQDCPPNSVVVGIPAKVVKTLAIKISEKEE